MAMDVIEPDLDGAGLRIGIVRARFNEWAGRALVDACVAELLALGVDEDDITQVSVPGALEVPLAVLKLAQAEDFDALIAAGCVIRGETYHFEIVANESAAGLSGVQLEFGVPVGNGVLTTENDAQALQRAEVKGYEAARAAIELANLLDAIDEA
jgi:6,7-dimethyl-8-ribityllumazine synthase